MAGNNYFDDDLNEITREADDLVSCMTATDQEDWDAQYRASLKSDNNRGKRTGGSRLVESSTQKKKSGGKGGLIALLIILLILIAALAAAFWRMNSTDGDLTSLMFWKQETQQEETLPPNTEDASAETETVEESAEPSEEPEETEAEVPQVSSPGTSTDTSDLALMQVLPNGFSSGLTTVNYDGEEQADAPVSLDKSILESVQELLAAANEAAEEGGYSDTETLRLHAFKVATGDPEAEIAEHETGLVVDFETYQNQHVWEFASAAPNTVAWLQEHAHEYGFIQRFPSDKESVTGVSGQPWHYSYVGVTVATEMYENGWCLEEYLAR